MAETEVKSINGRPVADVTARAKIEEIKNAAPGVVFDTVAEMEAYIAENAGTLKVGQDLFIRAADVPDYWWDGTAAVPVETELGEVKRELAELSEAIAELGGTLVEPAEDDIPKVFFGGALQQTKDEAVVPFRYISKTEDISGYAEIKAQGNSTMRFPKKNQTVKMYKDADCTEKLKVDFKGWGKQNKHCYKANWTDLSQARNVVSARIWGDIIKSRANYAELPELMRTSPNLGVIDGFPVKVYADGVYQGRYTLNIPKDKWMANMDDELDTHCILCGEGGNPALFRASWVSNGSGWSDEIHDAVPNSIMTRWNEVIDFVQNSTNEEFKANLDNYIDVRSLLDYHLFGLAMCGMDGYEKNQLFMTWDGIKWFAQVYDMDATWGLNWNAYFVATDYPRSSYEDMSGGGNLLYIRLEEVFWSELKARWAELKSSALSIENIINRFERFTDIMPEELVKEDYAATTADGAFTAIPLQGKNNVQQIRTYALARQKWVDEYLYRVAATSITLSQSTLTFTNETPATLVATVEPSDTTDSVVWTSTDENVAIVDGGVVTPLHDGSCVIRATAGIVSASCAVTVSGIETQYSVTNNLFGVTNSNTSASVTEGASYEATLTAKDGYTLEGATVTITMGGVDITSTVYSDGVITITNVTGNIVIAVAAVDTSVAYSLAETTFDGTNTAGIDTGIKLQDEVKDYTVFLDFTPVYGEGVNGGYKVLDAESIASPWPGWKVAGTQNESSEVSRSCIFNGDSTTTWPWNACLGIRHKFVLRHSGGNFFFAKEDATELTTVADGKINTTAHTRNMFIATGKYVGTIHSVKVWFEAKTDEECLAMVIS
ncbi:MAG: CotH kinase family protein [Clostridia bacterium]|nr:CotH kinase family protein [Clostridia bacterium]